jgi:hypothetical protein
MYLLFDIVDFGYKPLNYNKILDKWTKISKAIEPADSKTALHRQGVLQAMRNHPNTQLLTKTYKDSSGNQRRVATGIMVGEATPSVLRVDYVAGNPFSAKNKKLKGALQSLRAEAGTRSIDIDAITPTVKQLYNRRLGDKML